MEYQEFINNVDEMIRNHPEYRRGQAMFNTLYTMDYKLGDEIRGTILDPFHNNDKIDEFLNWLIHKLGYEDCPFCDNSGVYKNPSNGNAAQCEWCWTYTNSVFYQKNKLWEKESV